MCRRQGSVSNLVTHLCPRWWLACVCPHAAFYSFAWGVYDTCLLGMPPDTRYTPPLCTDGWSKTQTTACGDKWGGPCGWGTNSLSIGADGQKWQAVVDGDLSSCRDTCAASPMCAGFNVGLSDGKCYFRASTTCEPDEADSPPECYVINRDLGAREQSATHIPSLLP